MYLFFKEIIDKNVNMVITHLSLHVPLVRVTPLINVTSFTSVATTTTTITHHHPPPRWPPPPPTTTTATNACRCTPLDPLLFTYWILIATWGSVEVKGIISLFNNSQELCYFVLYLQLLATLGAEVKWFKTEVWLASLVLYLQKLADMAEVLQAREDKLLNMSKENCELMEANSIIRK